MIWQRNKFTVVRNREYKETDSMNSVQSSLKPHPLWVTLYNCFRVIQFQNKLFFTEKTSYVNISNFESQKNTFWLTVKIKNSLFLNTLMGLDITAGQNFVNEKDVFEN